MSAATRKAIEDAARAIIRSARSFNARLSDPSTVEVGGVEFAALSAAIDAEDKAREVRSIASAVAEALRGHGVNVRAIKGGFTVTAKGPAKAKRGKR